MRKNLYGWQLCMCVPERAVARSFLHAQVISHTCTHTHTHTHTHIKLLVQFVVQKGKQLSLCKCGPHCGGYYFSTHLRCEHHYVRQKCVDVCLPSYNQQWNICYSQFAPLHQCHWPPDESELVLVMCNVAPHPYM